jgi:hypothetical protein
MNKKIAIFFEDDPFLASPFIKKIIQIDQKNNNLDFVFINVKSNLKVKKIIFFLFIFGLSDFFKILLNYIKNKNFIKNISYLKKNKNYFETSNINSKKLLKKLKSKEINTVLSLNCSQIFKKYFLINFKKKFNIHLGDLKKYRGIFPIYYALHNNENYFKISIHSMSEKIDYGEVVKYFKVKRNKSNNILINYLVCYNVILLNINKIIKIICSVHVRKKKNIAGIYRSYPKFVDIIKYKFKKYFA